MLILDYDEFNIYNNIEDIENFVKRLIQEGIEIEEEIYNKCVDHFGLNYKDLIDDFFNDKD
jgi:hypothetical protein